MKIIGIDGYNSFLGNNFISKYEKSLKIFKFNGDINNIKDIKKFINKKKINIFIRIASLSRSSCEENKIKCYKTNYLANKRLVDYLIKKKIKLIFLSTSHVYKTSNKKLNEKSQTNPQDKYSFYKLKTENYIKNKLHNYLIIRSFNIYGKNQKSGFFIPDIRNKILNSENIIINNSVRDFIKVDDVSRFIKFTIKKNINGIYNLGTGKSISLKELILSISKKLNKKIKLTVNKKKDKLVNDKQSLKKIGFKLKYEKNFNF